MTLQKIPPWEEQRPADTVEPEPLHDGSDRYRIYVLVREGNRKTHRQLGDTSLDGIGGALALWREEGTITADDRIGIRDRTRRMWIVNPYAAGRKERP